MYPPIGECITVLVVNAVENIMPLKEAVTTVFKSKKKKCTESILKKKMKITKFDPILNKSVTLEVPITEEQYKKIQNRVDPIQHIAPSLSVDLREFLISGISPEGWALYELYNPERHD